jgi:probable F420-dependent oxidoreductase
MAGSAAEWAATARRAEAAGYSTLLMPDTTGPTLSPMPALAIAAASTTTLHVGNWVLVNDFRNPVLLAREAATLDLLTDGRFELGLGAGRPDNDYGSFGLELESGGVRVSRLAESVRIIDGLLRGERVTATGPHYSIRDAVLFPRPARKPPVLLAAGGRRALELAGSVADIVATGFGSREHISQQLGWLSAAAGARFPQIELSSAFFPLPEGDERTRQATAAFLRRLGADLDTMVAARPPNLLMGSTAAMVEQLEAVRETFGITYVATSRDLLDAFAPVVAKLANR